MRTQALRIVLTSAVWLVIVPSWASTSISSRFLALGFVTLFRGFRSFIGWTIPALFSATAVSARLIPVSSLTFLLGSIVRPLIAGTTLLTTFLFPLRIVESGKAILPNGIVKGGFHDLHFLLVEFFQRGGFLALVIHLNDLIDDLDRKGDPIHGIIGRCVPNGPLEDVHFLLESLSLLGSQDGVGFWELFQCLDIGVEFIVEATLQFATLSCQFGGVKAQLLISRRTGIDRSDVGQPGGTAKFTTAGANSTQS